MAFSFCLAPLAVTTLLTIQADPRVAAFNAGVALVSQCVTRFFSNRIGQYIAPFGLGLIATVLCARNPQWPRLALATGLATHLVLTLFAKPRKVPSKDLTPVDQPPTEEMVQGLKDRVVGLLTRSNECLELTLAEQNACRDKISELRGKKEQLLNEIYSSYLELKAAEGTQTPGSLSTTRGGAGAGAGAEVIVDPPISLEEIELFYRPFLISESSGIPSSLGLKASQQGKIEKAIQLDRKIKQIPVLKEQIESKESELEELDKKSRAIKIIIDAIVSEEQGGDASQPLIIQQLDSLIEQVSSYHRDHCDICAFMEQRFGIREAQRHTSALISLHLKKGLEFYKRIDEYKKLIEGLEEEEKAALS